MGDTGNANGLDIVDRALAAAKDVPAELQAQGTYPPTSKSSSKRVLTQEKMQREKDGVKEWKIDVLLHKEGASPVPPGWVLSKEGASPVPPGWVLRVLAVDSNARQLSPNGPYGVEESQTFDEYAPARELFDALVEKWSLRL